MNSTIALLLLIQFSSNFTEDRVLGRDYKNPKLSLKKFVRANLLTNLPFKNNYLTNLTIAFLLLFQFSSKFY